MRLRSLSAHFPKRPGKKLPSTSAGSRGGEMDKDLFKKLNDDIWELRTSYGGMCYRLLAFWDKERRALIIATHGFVKKTWKVPHNEIDRAEAIMRQYYSNE